MDESDSAPVRRGRVAVIFEPTGDRSAFKRQHVLPLEAMHASRRPMQHQQKPQFGETEGARLEFGAHAVSATTFSHVMIREGPGAAGLYRS